MNREAFEQRLREQGYTEVVVRKLDGNLHNQDHDHPYDVHALVLDGEITIACDGPPRTYRVGDEFIVAAGKPHEEWIGPAGVTYVVGRR